VPERNGSDAVNQPTDAPAPTIDSTASAPLPVAPATPAPTPLPTVNAEPDEKIHVAAGGKLIVPREDLLAELDDGTEMDLVDGLPKKIRKPDRREWIVLNRASEFTIRLLIHKPKADGIEVEHYHIAMPLRDPIRDEFKSVRIFLYYSLKTKTYNLWVLNVTIDNTWYESLAQLSLLISSRKTQFESCRTRRISATGLSSNRSFLRSPGPRRRSASCLLRPLVGTGSLPRPTTHSTAT
jgi:hypothetical protein